ncbi:MULTISPECIES: FHA domain-containing protein [Spirulina sp. CCY15215]|uniref:FHA domain-containing protein n=1 Tax=Spirulina sp. CCY15215 TaxID=2767591 RepID=UPI00194EE28E|nr:FHA domain-containing protein [Spirulina major]
MIVCPNCNHQNPDGATQCEACYTPLPTMTNCPNCGTIVQVDASFCGQCGYNLQETNITVAEEGENNGIELSKSEVSTPPPVSSSTEATVVEEQSISSSLPPISTGGASTQLQVKTASLLHLQTDTVIEFPQNLPVIHIGKPGGPIPPDVDVSGFSDSAIVSRVHADIRVEADLFFIEDVGSANGTYINHNPLPPGNRHRLRAGDRIALGKEDKVTFIFQLA